LEKAKMSERAEKKLAASHAFPCSHDTGDEAGGISNRSGRNLLCVAVANFCWGRLLNLGE
jgi:hypothetical protein